MQMCLLLKDLWTSIIEERPEGTGRAAQEFDRKSAHALAMIHLNCEPDQQQLIVECEEASEAWDILCRKFEAPTMANVTYLEEQFHRLKIEKDQTVEAFCSEVKALATRLSTLRAPVSSQRIISKILHGLPSSFDALVMGLSLPNVGELDVDAVVEQVIAAEQRMSLRVQATAPQVVTEIAVGPTALTVREAPSNDERQNLICHYCKRRGHSSNVCYDKYPSLRPSHWAPLKRRSDSPQRDRTPDRRRDRTPDRRREKSPDRYRNRSRGRYSPREAVSNRNREREEDRRPHREERGREVKREKDPTRQQHCSQSRTLSPKRSSSKGPKCMIMTSQQFEHNFSMLSKELSLGNNGMWIWDSGASSHMSANRNIFSSMRKLEPFPLMTGNGELMAYGIGEVPITLRVGGRQSIVKLNGVLWIPELTGGYNLLSVPSLTNLGYTVVFNSTEVRAEKGGVVCAVGRKSSDGSAWMLQLWENERVCMMTQKGRVDTQPLEIWHKRLGHLNKDAITKLLQLSTGMQIGEQKKSYQGCTDCLRGGFPKMISRIPMSRATIPSERIHSDISGQIRPSRLGFLYLAVFVDEATRWKSTYAMNKKNDVRAAWRAFKARFETFSERRIKCLHIDNGTEYLEKHFLADLANAGIQLETTQYYSPEMNGIAERAIGVICTRASAMLCASELPITFWPEATACATFVINRSPTKGLRNSTPYEQWFGRKPCIGFLRIFGCRASARVPQEKRRKFDDAAFKCLHMGYYESENLYQVWDVAKGKMVKVRDVKFFEDVLGHPTLLRNVVPEDTIIPKDTDIFGKRLILVDVEPPEEDDEEDLHDHDAGGANGQVPSPVAREVPIGPELEPAGNQQAFLVSTTTKDVLWPPLLGEVCIEEVNDKENDKGLRAPIAFTPEEKDTTSEDMENFILRLLAEESLTEAPDVTKAVVGLTLPLSAKEALGGPNKKYWLWAMVTEIRGLLTQHTFTLVPRPREDSNVIPAKWVFDLKTNIDGSIKRFKARWVARGDLQKYGIDYKETFAPVAKASSLRILLIWAAEYDLEIDQIDVVTAFLYPDIDKTVYLQQPLGFRLDERVCRLNKALYGLCQSAKCWYEHLDATLTSRAFRRLNADYALWTNGRVWIVAHVDDLLIIGNRLCVDQVKRYLGSVYKISNLGSASIFIGLHITRDRDNKKVYLDQKHYITEFMDALGMKSANPVKFPMTDKDRDVFLTKDNVDEGLKQVYQQTIGFLMFLMISTRPDISFHVTRLAQRCATPTPELLAIAKQVCRYVIGSASSKLQLGGRSFTDALCGYFDAAHQDHPDYHTTFGYVFLYHGSPVSWKTRKHSLVTISTTESEYVAGAEAVREALWLHRLINELGFKLEFPIPLFNDNQGAIQLSKNPGYHDRTKHIGVRRRLLTEHSELKQVKVCYMNTSELIADTLTKALNTDKFYEHGLKMGVIFETAVCKRCPEKSFSVRSLAKHMRRNV